MQGYSVVSSSTERRSITNYNDCLTRLLQGLLERPDQKEGSVIWSWFPFQCLVLLWLLTPWCIAFPNSVVTFQCCVICHDDILHCCVLWCYSLFHCEQFDWNTTFQKLYANFSTRQTLLFSKWSTTANQPSAQYLTNSVTELCLVNSFCGTVNVWNIFFLLLCQVSIDVICI